MKFRRPRPLSSRKPPRPLPTPEAPPEPPPRFRLLPRTVLSPAPSLARVLDMMREVTPREADAYRAGAQLSAMRARAMKNFRKRSPALYRAVLQDDDEEETMTINNGEAPLRVGDEAPENFWGAPA